MINSTDKEVIDARLRVKVAAMSVDERCARIQAIVASPDRDSEELTLEFAKLLLGPDAEIADETTHADND
jgi:hypothetical protein